MTTPAAGRPGWESCPADADQLVEVLHRCGPCPYDALRHEVEASGWDRQRLEDALVVAWADGRIFFDSRDELVAL